MPTSLEQLDREATMLLYLAGELTPAERELMAARLAAEPQLAAELEQLRAAQASVVSHLELADAHTRLPASEGVVVRRVSRSISQWLAIRQEQRAAAPASKRAVPVAWWWYPTAMAASLVIGFLVWSSRQEVGPMPAIVSAQLEAEETELAEWLSSSLEVTADASMSSDLDQLLSAGGGDDLSSIYLLPREEMTQ